jgi:hypothetical protein
MVPSNSFSSFIPRAFPLAFFLRAIERKKRRAESDRDQRGGLSLLPAEGQ